LTEETPQSPQPWSPLPLLWALLLNAIPLYGVLVAGWSWGTGFALYCCEYLLSVLFAALRMVIHRRLTGKPDYRQGNVDVRVAVNGKERFFRSSSLIVELLVVSLGSSVGMGLLFALIFGLLLARDPGAAIQPLELQKGLIPVTLLMLGSFLVDLRGLRDRPFAWIRGINQSAMDRMGVIIFTLFFGLVAVAMLDVPMAFFWIFTVFKLFAEIVRALPHRKRSAELSRELRREERRAAKDEVEERRMRKPRRSP
jgi:hypothetical protein